MRQRYLIIFASLIGMTALWFLFLLSPVIRQRQEISAKTVETKDRLVEFNRIMADFPRHFKLEKEFLKRRELLSSQLYSKGDLIRLFDEFEGIAQKHHVRLIEISPSIEELLALNRRAAKDTLPQILEISLQINGPFCDAGEFIREIEARSFYKGLRFCRIINDVDGRKTSDIKYTFMAVLGTMKVT
ncbi:MAG: hypothetical protein JSV44_01820 [Candidatus Zixiibacteriota bacterium]|nr:MAG: hypothetical protein JSV44_01820 [candidate division Zixibacteria bacterium]